MHSQRRTTRPLLWIALIGMFLLSSAAPAAISASDLTFELTPSATTLQMGQHLNVTVVAHSVPAVCNVYPLKGFHLTKGGEHDGILWYDPACQT